MYHALLIIFMGYKILSGIDTKPQKFHQHNYGVRTCLPLQDTAIFFANQRVFSSRKRDRMQAAISLSVIRILSFIFLQESLPGWLACSGPKASNIKNTFCRLPWLLEWFFLVTRNWKKKIFYMKYSGAAT